MRRCKRERRRQGEAMKDSDRLKRIKELNELLNVPELDIIFFLFMDDVKRKHAAHIEAYRSVKSRFREVGKGRMRLIENKSPRQHRKLEYYFELNRVQGRDNREQFEWAVTRIEPRTFSSVDKIIPPEFLELIEFQQSDPEKMELLEKFKSKKLRKHFDISFTKISNNHAVGNIRRSIMDDQNPTELIDVSAIDVDFQSDIEKEEREYIELLNYMEKYPEIRDEIFNYFYMIQKPMADSKPDLKSS